jgi:glycosyltransferase involved in cell wall biosynthesis
MEPVVKKPLKILHAFSTLNPGGAEMRFVKLANWFGSEFEHLLVAMDGNIEASKLLDPKVCFEVLPLKVRKGKGLPNFRLFRQILSEKSPDLLITYNFGAFEWIFSGVGLGIKHFHVEDGFTSEEVDKRFFRRNSLRRLGFKISPSTLITISRTLDDIASDEWGVSERKRLFIPNGIELSRFSSLDSGSHAIKANDSSGEFVIGTVARFSLEKRIDRLISAVKRLQLKYPNLPIRLILVGDGPSRQALEEQVSNLQMMGITEFTGRIAEPAALYKRFSVFALSSDTEQMPLSVLEAMASGLPIVSPDVGDVKHMLGHSNAMAISGKTESAIFSQLDLLCTNSLLRQQYGRDNAERANLKYGFESMADAWGRVFRCTV